MTRRAQLLALAAVLGGVAVGACGGGAAHSSTTRIASRPSPTTAGSSASSSAASTSSAATTTRRTATTRPAPVAPALGPTQPTTTVHGSSATGATGAHATIPILPASPPNRGRRLALCLKMVANFAGTVLTTAEQAGLDTLCREAAFGDAAQVARAKRQICLTAVADSGLPRAAARAEDESCPLATPDVGTAS